MDRKRRKRIERAVAQALKLHGVEPESGQGESEGGSLEAAVDDATGALQRPQRLRLEWGEFSSPPRREEEVFRPGFWRVLSRLFVWNLAGLRLAMGIAWAFLLRKNTAKSRATTLRRTLERMGPTAVKLGQQMSMRIDLVPYTYAHELEKMLDSVPPFPTGQAIEAIEETVGEKVDTAFAKFDREPIASASIACVFQALLPTGEKVAIKVRRPGIGQLIAADMRALSWIMRVLELVVLPPGFANQFVGGLRTMLLEELDFVREARYTDTFRIATRKSKLDSFTAPKVYFDYSGRKVLVTEFLSGVFLTEVLGAVEMGDRRALKELEKMNINPKKVAKRLVRINQYGTFESLLFHADVHPANVLVQPGNKLVLIDFGSCGSFTEQERTIWRRLLATQAREDVGGMVQAAVELLEPLPPIDVDGFKRKIEGLFWKDLFAIKSKHSEWWERTTASLWLDIIRVARQYRVPVDLNTLRMIRVTLLADTVALRLDRDTDHYKEYRRYMRGAGRRAQKRLRRRFGRGLRGEDFVEWENVLSSGSKAIYRIQRNLDTTAYNYAKLQSKASFAISEVFRTGLIVIACTALAAGVTFVVKRWRLGEDDTLWSVFLNDVSTAWPYQVFLVLVALVAVRRLLFRLGDREV